MKKKLLVVVVAVMAVSGVTACGGSAPETDEKAKFEAVNEAVGQAESGSDYYRTEDGFLFQDAEGGAALFRYDGEEENVVVPETYEGKSVVALGESCFSMNMHGESELKSVTLPESVTVIGINAFGACHGLTSVNIPEHVTEIRYQAFADCTSLEGITIPGSVTEIGDNAFIYCESLTGVVIEDGVMAIGEKAFQHCINVESITIPGSVASVGRWAFDGCENLTNVTIEDGVTQIADYAFGECKKLTGVALPDSVTALGKAFQNCDQIAVTYKGITYTDDTMDDLYELFDEE